MTAAALAASLGNGLGGGPPRGGAAALALSLVVAGGLVEGVALGLAQATGLRGVLSPPAPALGAGDGRGRGAGLGWAAGPAPGVLSADEAAAPPPVLPLLLGAAALGAAMGALLGAAQAAVLRGAVARPWRWVGASTSGWTPAMMLIFLGAGAPGADWPVAAVVATGAGSGLLAGAALGLIIGWLMPGITRR